MQLTSNKRKRIEKKKTKRYQPEIFNKLFTNIENLKKYWFFDPYYVIPIMFQFFFLQEEEEEAK